MLLYRTLFCFDSLMLYRSTCLFLIWSFLITFLDPYLSIIISLFSNTELSHYGILVLLIIISEYKQSSGYPYRYTYVAVDHPPQHPILILETQRRQYEGHNTPLGYHTDQGPWGCGQCYGQGLYWGPSTASEVFLIFTT